MFNPNTPIEELKNVGSRHKSKLAKLDIKTARDLLWHFPSRYDDYSETLPISSVQAGEKVNIQGEVMKVSVSRIFKLRMTIVNAVIQDETGAIKASWFNQPYIANSLKEGDFISMAGKATTSKKYGLFLTNPTYEKMGRPGETSIPKGLTHTKGLVPVYPETEGVSSKYLRYIIKPILEYVYIPDYLPTETRKRNGFIDLNSAIKFVHYPKTPEDAQRARERLAFDDLLLFQMKSVFERRKTRQLKSIPIPFDKELITKFIKTLPFELTKDQKVAAWEILQDIEKSYPMNRLMEGDVGSGKTVVALIASVQVMANQYQAVWLAPTEVLARQHYESVTKLLKNSLYSIGIMTSSESKIDGSKVSKAEFKKRAEKGQLDLVIGTHAVLQKDVTFPKLALVVIDEQHRFGVKQRSQLVKGKDKAPIPHLLSMTATPIPRTLALTIYGDLDISIIKEKPKNRKVIKTLVVEPERRKSAYDFIEKEIKNGRQAFVVCPRIEVTTDTEGVKTRSPQFRMNLKEIWSEAKAAEEEYIKLSKEIFPHLRVAMVHGKLKPKDKNEVMEKFSQGEYDILVSTSVIEVGVDIPNASVMAIENADRFGLAQLHQFRGRVGRSEHQSYCILFCSEGGHSSNARLNAMVKTDDGFLLAEKDMAIRGPGEFMGDKQSGVPDLVMTSLANVELIKKARAEARAILKSDPSLYKFPALKQRLDSFQRMNHFE